MAGLRSNRALNRGNRGAPDHDIMEGLPVRQWRKQNVVVSTKPPKEEAPANDDPSNRWRELPMPRGSEQYSPMSQALLRAARRGRISQQQNKQNGEDKDLEEEEKKAPEPDVGIATTKWSQISKDQEKPELEFLAKRRKGLPSMHTDPITAQPMKLVKVKKVDAEGNAAIFDVLAPEGAVVEGEIVKDEAVPTEAPAPGTVVEGVGVVNEEGIVIAALEPAVLPTPPRRAPPRPKRKAKGPGRGRKKKKEVHTPSATTGAEAGVSADGTANGVQASGDTLQVPDPSGDPASGTDVEMGENSPAREGDEGSDDDDDEEGDASDIDAPTRSVSPMKAPDGPKQPLDSESANIPSIEPTQDDTNVTATESGAPGTVTEPPAPTDMDTAMDAEPTLAAVAPEMERLPEVAPAASTESASETILATAPIQTQDPLTTPMEGVDMTAPLPISAPPIDTVVPPPEPMEPAADSVPPVLEPPVQPEAQIELPSIIAEPPEALAGTSEVPLPAPDQAIGGPLSPPPPPQPAESLPVPPAVPTEVVNPPPTVDIGTAEPIPPPMPVEPVVEDASAPEPPPILEEPAQAAASTEALPAETTTEARDGEAPEAIPAVKEPETEPPKE